MIIHDCTQGTTKWLQLRSGIPTASEFSKIITNSGKPSASADPYINTLIAERLLEKPLVEYMSFWMERGSQMEAEAVSYYEFQRDCEVERVGFVTNDEKTIGASPDRFVGEDGLLEIKCPAPDTHISYLLFDPASKKYQQQIQGQLWITERKWVDVLSYYPGLPEALIRVERDEEYMESLAKLVTGFVGQLEERFERIKEIIGGER